MIAGDRSEDGIRGGGDDEGGDLDEYELWREMKRQVSLLRDDMDTRDVQYHVQGPMDLAWHAPDTPSNPTITPPAGPSTATATTTRTPDVSSTLPFRPGAGRAARNLHNPRLMAVDCDSRHAPLMTDDGMFVDSSFDED